MRIKIPKNIKKISFSFILIAFVSASMLYLGSFSKYDTTLINSWVQRIENTFYDVFFKIQSAKNESSKEQNPHIYIVDIDETSLSKFGHYNEWNRQIHAKVVENLSQGGAAAIAFDILFKNADFGEKKARQTLSVLQNIFPENPWEAVFQNIKGAYNDDSILIERVRQSQNVILAASFDDKTAYKHQSEWMPLSDWNRSLELNTFSTLSLEQIDTPNSIEPKDLLDNIFPELASASPYMGVINAYPDYDGVLRRVSMLYQFPNKDLHPRDSSIVYTTMPLSTIIHLFGIQPDQIKVTMGEAIDLGKAFGIIKDSSGFRSTYPHFSFPMFQSLVETLPKLEASSEKSNEFFEVSQKVIAQKDSDGVLNFEIYEGQWVSPRLSQALQIIAKEDPSIKTQNFKLEHGIHLQKKGTEFWILDSLEDEEIKITPHITQSIAFFEKELENLKKGESKYLSTDLTLRYDKIKKEWKSNIAVLTKDVIDELKTFDLTRLLTLKTGEEIRFGNVKKIPIDELARYQIAYHDRYTTDPKLRHFTHLSYYDVALNRLDPAMYQSNIFILGSAATALFDYVSTPHDENFPAILAHATIIENILNDDFLVDISPAFQKLFVLGFILCCVLLGVYTNTYISTLSMLILLSAYSFLGYHYFEKGLYLGFAKPSLAIIFSSLGAMLIRYYIENKEKRFLNSAFKQYISPELIDTMLKNEIMPTLGGEKSYISAYFTDIAHFSSFSEQIGDPVKLVELLNEYLGAMTETLLKHQGTLDKYVGDAIVAFFGAPMPLKNHAQHACETALAMQNTLGKLREKWREEKEKWPPSVSQMRMRIGINSGEIVTGNMGSSMRKNYTMMGDAVNLAARLESIAKSYGVYIFISESTQKLLPQNLFITRSIDNIRVVGKTEPVKAYELLGFKSEDSSQAIEKLVELWEAGRLAYENQNWEQAMEIFKQTLPLEPFLNTEGAITNPSLLYLHRCKEYSIHPPVAPGQEWDKVYTATQK